MIAEQLPQNGRFQRLRRCNAGRLFPEPKRARVAKNPSPTPVTKTHSHDIETLPSFPVMPAFQSDASQTNPRCSRAPKWLRNANDEVVENPWRRKSEELSPRIFECARAHAVAEAGNSTYTSTIPPPLFLIPGDIETHFAATGTSSQGNSLSGLTSPAGAPSPQTASSSLLLPSLPKFTNTSENGSFQEGHLDRTPGGSISSTHPDSCFNLPNVSQLRNNLRSYSPALNESRAPMTSSHHVGSIRHRHSTSSDSRDTIELLLAALQPTSWAHTAIIGGGSMKGGIGRALMEEDSGGGSWEGTSGLAAFSGKEGGGRGPDLWSPLPFQDGGLGGWGGLKELGYYQSEDPCTPYVVPESFTQAGRTWPLMRSNEAEMVTGGVMGERYAALGRVSGVNADVTERHLRSRFEEDEGEGSRGLPSFQDGYSNVYHPHLESLRELKGLDDLQNGCFVDDRVGGNGGYEWWRDN